MTQTYKNIMDGRTWRAAHFDWQFKVAGGSGPSSRDAILLERKKFVNMVQELKFTIYGDVKVTRNLSKQGFIKELKKCEYVKLNFCMYSLVIFLMINIYNINTNIAFARSVVFMHITCT